MVTKDELFSLEDSLPQASFVAAANSRYVSIKQGKADHYSQLSQSFHPLTAHLLTAANIVNLILLLNVICRCGRNS